MALPRPPKPARASQELAAARSPQETLFLLALAPPIIRSTLAGLVSRTSALNILRPIFSTKLSRGPGPENVRSDISTQTRLQKVADCLSRPYFLVVVAFFCGAGSFAAPVPELIVVAPAAHRHTASNTSSMRTRYLANVIPTPVVYSRSLVLRPGAGWLR